jgi:alpha-mannosidase
MGHEFRGGTFREAGRAGERPARLEVQERDGGLEVIVDTELDGLPLRRLYWFQADSPLIRLRIEGRAVDGRTVTVRFHTGLSASRLVMDQPGGVVARPPARIYDPTFWPLQHFLHLQDVDSGRGLALWLRRPGAVSYQPGGRLELVALRNANRERAFGLLPIPATPATGHERSSYTFDYALWFTSAGNWRENGVDRQARALSRSALEAQMFPGAAPFAAQGTLAASPVTVDDASVEVIAVKPASRGQGLIARLHTFTTPLPTVTLAAPGRAIKSAYLCDARERDLEPLELREGLVHLPMPGAIATVRLRV